MSRSASFPLLHLLLLLSLAVCSCKARPIGLIKKQDEGPSGSSHFSSKDEEKSSDHARVSISSNAKHSNQKESEAAHELDGSHVGNTVNKQAKSVQKFKHHELNNDQRNKVATDNIQSESPATVSWKLPHPKAGDRQPGFNLDYDPHKRTLQFTTEILPC